MTTQPRLHTLDSLRAIALLLGIVLHASMSFLQEPGSWIVADNSPSITLSVLMHVIHTFRMALFFILAGFFAKVSINSKGDKKFAQDRFKRIAIPFVLGWLVFYPLMALIGVAATAKAGMLPPEASGYPLPIVTLGFFLRGYVFENGIPTGHLWFLYYLSMFYAAALALRAIARSMKKPAGLHDAFVRLGSSGKTPIALLALVASALYFGKGWSGIPTPDWTLVPQAPVLLGYGACFAYGWLLATGERAGLLVLTKRWPGLLIAGGLCCALSLISNPAYLPDVNDSIQIALRSIYTLSYAIAMIGLSGGLIGLFLKLPNKESVTMRYLADSSYWLYLAHLPLVMAFQLLVSDWHAQWALKFLFILVASIFILLLSYHYLVRPTFIGQALNGKRFPRRSSAPIKGE